MFRVFRAEWYESKLKKLSSKEQERVGKFEQSLKAQQRVIEMIKGNLDKYKSLLEETIKNI